MGLSNKPGVIVKTITLKTNDPDNPLVYFRIRARTKDFYKMIDDGEYDRDEFFFSISQGFKTIKIKYLDKKFKIKNISFLNGKDIEVKDIIENDKEQTLAITFRYKENRKLGSLFEMVYITTDVEEYPKIVLRVVGQL